MKNGLFKKWLAAALCVLALGSTAALAEPDTFYLGTGRNGSPPTLTTTGNVINSYAQVTGPLAPGDTSIPIGACLGDPACFAGGDLVLVLQTTGIVPAPASGATGPVDISNDPVGRWEFARLAPGSGSTLTLTAPLIHSYAASVTQVIRVPEYVDLTIADTGSINAAPWNGSAGGVIAFLATGTVDNAGQINANAAGFRGGQYVRDATNGTGCSGLDEAAARGAQKGEGIANGAYGTTATGRGSVTNGAGGGVCRRSGGGGGGNYAVGGIGGRSAGTDGSRTVGGMGGRALVYSLVDRLTLGGGGGAGHGTGTTGTPGGQGGGAIFIRANQLTGLGTIVASGGRGGSPESDGGGGGGAGGSIYLRFASTATCDTVIATGGLGGGVNALRVGPGGGGSGGRLLFQADTGGTCDFSLSGVAPGTQQDNMALDGATYGATAGGDGVPLTLLGRFVVPPVPTVTTPRTGSSTSNLRPFIEGTAQPNTTVVIYIDGVAVGTATSNAAGTYIFVPPTNLSEGSHTVQAAAAEPYGAQSPRSAANTFTVDVTKPDTVIVSGPAGPTNATSATFDFDVAVAEPGGVRYECSLNGATFTDCTDPETFSGLTERSHTLQVRAIDAAGNVDDAPASYTWVVDLTAPNTVIVSGPPSRTNATSATFDFDVTAAEPGVTYECSLDGAAFAPCADPETFTGLTAQKLYTLEVRAKDALGNVDPTPATYSWTVDLTPPAAPVVASPAPNSTVDTSTPVITGTAEPHSTVTVIIDGQVAGTAQTDAAGNWSYTPTTPLAQGPHEVQVRTTDEAGNSSTPSAPSPFTVADTMAPETTITSGPSDTTPERSATFELGSNEPGVTFECSLDGAAFTPCTSPVTFSDLAEGEHTLQVRARDAAGNVDATPATRTWTVSAGNTDGDIAFLGDGVGCSATGGDASLVLMGLGTFLTLARRRRRS